MSMKQMTADDWSTYYANPHNYAKVFQDLAMLVKKAYTAGLSTSEAYRKRVVEGLINANH